MLGNGVTKNISRHRRVSQSHPQVLPQPQLLAPAAVPSSEDPRKVKIQEIGSRNSAVPSSSWHVPAVASSPRQLPPAVLSSSRLLLGEPGSAQQLPATPGTSSRSAPFAIAARCNGNRPGAMGIGRRPKQNRPGAMGIRQRPKQNKSIVFL